MNKHWTERKQLKNEKIVNKLMKNYVRKAKSYLRKYKKDLNKIATILYEKGECSYKDLSL